MKCFGELSLLRFGLGERVLGLGVLMGEGLRPLVGLCGVEYDDCLCRRVSLYSLSPGLVLCLYWFCGCWGVWYDVVMVFLVAWA